MNISNLFWNFFLRKFIYCLSISLTSLFLQFLILFPSFSSFFRSLFSLKLAAYEEYQAVKGDKVSLACNSSHWYENSVSLVLWYREFSDVPIYTLDVRDGSLSKSHHIKSPSFKDRAYFDVSINPPRLVLDNVTKLDQGLFRCRVSSPLHSSSFPLIYSSLSFIPTFSFSFTPTSFFLLSLHKHCLNSMSV